MIHVKQGRAGVDTFYLRHFHLQNISIEEQRCIEGLILGRGRDVFVYRQMGQKGAHFVGAQIARMVFVMKKDVPLLQLR